MHERHGHSRRASNQDGASHDLLMDHTGSWSLDITLGLGHFGFALSCTASLLSNTSRKALAKLPFVDGVFGHLVVVGGGGCCRGNHNVLVVVAWLCFLISSYSSCVYFGGIFLILLDLRKRYGKLIGWLALAVLIIRSKYQKV